MSPDTARIATNGSRKVAIRSNAPKVGMKMPSSGVSASDRPAGPPAPPLISLNDRTALMKDSPTSGPVSASITHQARDAISSRHSLASSHDHGAAALGEGKEDLLERLAAGGGAARRRQR